MKILKASWLLTLNAQTPFIKEGACVYDEKILDYGEISYIKDKYNNLEIEDLGENSVLMPGLINPHVHLEFSSNTTSLEYGNFMTWLNSVIRSRDEIIEKASSEVIEKKLTSMLKTGTTTIGAISSYSFDLNACVKSAMNTVFFTEVIGSKMEMADTLFADFKSRLNQAKKFKSKNFFPGVAIHSPYSVHPFLVREALNLAREDDLAVSAHFMESAEEKEWLESSSGGFLTFFKNFLNQEEAVTKDYEFLNCFKHLKALSFTHCVEASKKNLEQIKNLGASINHCVRSNRLLNNTKLDLNKLDVPYTIATDGLSSNISLSMFDELRAALFMHNDKEVNSFSKELLIAATKNAADALGLKKGLIQKDYDADLISLVLPDEIKNEESLFMHVILHTKRVKKVIIGGVNV